jgi:heparan-alpha-glucosaminide N-acetyltransferase
MGRARVYALEVTPAKFPRNQAVDAYRGLVMLLMMAEILQLSRVARALPGNAFWSFLAYHQTHVEWAGCSLHDTIQPGFSFLVGVALPYSIAARIAKGGSFGPLFLHALWRSLLLVALGVFLRSTHAPQTYYTFEDTLSQIGLGYPILFVLAWKPPKWQWIAFGAILFAYWLAWAIYPAHEPGFFSGFLAHWNKGDNFGNAFDQWFLNLFPRTKPYIENGGGYLTLSFIPTLGTMLLGLAAGRWLRESAPSIPMRRLLTAGVIGIAAGLLLHFAGICPIVKRIWTPAWTLFSGGICFLFLAAFCWVIEVKHYRRWAFVLVVVGMNSIGAYLIAHLWEGFFLDSLRIHLGEHAFAFAGGAVEPFVRGLVVLTFYWLVLFWMYRRKLFLKI